MTAPAPPDQAPTGRRVPGDPDVPTGRRAPGDPDAPTGPRPPADPAAPSRQLGVAVLVALLLALGLGVAAQYQPYTFLHGDGAFYATTNRSLADGTLAQRAYQPASWYEQALGWNRSLDQGWSNVAVGADGTWYPKHPFLLPLVTTPLYVALGPVGLLAFNLLMTALVLWLAWRLACRWAPPPVAAVAALACAAQPLFTGTAYSYSNDAFYGVLVLGGLEAWLRGGLRTSGALFGLAIWAKATNVVFGLPLGLWLLAHRRWRDALRFGVAAAVPVGIWLAANAIMFGSPFVTSYDRILVVRDGQPALESVRERFQQPLLAGAWGLLTEPGSGLLSAAGLLVLGVLGAPWLARRAPRAAALGALWLVLYAVMYGPYDYRYARFAIPWVALLLVPLAVLLERAAAGLARLAAWLAARPARAAAAAGLAAAALLAAALVPAAPGVAWSAVEALPRAEVVRRAGPRETPCDYFNPNHERFECAQVERDTWQWWGRAHGGACRVGGEARDWLWLHVPPGAEKAITFRGVPPGDLRLRYGLSEPSRHGAVPFTLSVGGAEPLALETGGPGELAERLVAAADRAGDTVTLTVPRQPADWRQLCVELVVPRASEVSP